MDTVTLRAPATVANLSCGFDILGACLKEPYDEITISKIPERKILINILESEFSNIPSNPKENTGGIPAELILKDLSLDFGFEISIKKGIPLCGGLGSSAATAAGVSFGIAKLLNEKISNKDIIRYALEGEKLSSETPHADNIGPCILGGLVIIRDTFTLDLINVPVKDFSFAIIHPDVKIDTKTARKLLPEKISMKQAVEQWGNVASLVYGFSSNDISLISRSMEDNIVEPVRSKLIPEYDNIKKAAIDHGAIGCSISGSGPSVFALCNDDNQAEKIKIEMEKVLLNKSIGFHSYVSKINNQGIEIL